jgi:hypothetical protein
VLELAANTSFLGGREVREADGGARASVTCGRLWEKLEEAFSRAGEYGRVIIVTPGGSRNAGRLHVRDMGVE